MFMFFIDMSKFLVFLQVILIILIVSEDPKVAAHCGKKATTKQSSLSTAIECSRTCQENEPPKRCYYQFVLEYYVVLGEACQLCTPNSTNALQSNCQCVNADGVERGFSSVNRMLPGPSIEICQGDEVIVDVKNRMPASEATIHWHGIFQKGTQYNDGVPFVTQCPIPSGNTHRYRWTGDAAGTYFWHSHSGFQKYDGVHGALIIRQPKNKEPHGNLYDHDLTTHQILLADWIHQYAIEIYPGLRAVNLRGQWPTNILINGKGQFTDRKSGETTNTPIEVFKVSQGQRYRFRMINAFGGPCAVALTIQNHFLTVIATDTESVQPVAVNTIVSMTGERYDFVINANQSIGSYWIQIRLLGTETCAPLEISQVATLQYENAPIEPSTPSPTFSFQLPDGIVLNPLDGNCANAKKDVVCVDRLKSMRPVTGGITKKIPDMKLYMPFGFLVYEPAYLFTPNTYNHFMNSPQGVLVEAHIDGISYISPDAPPISQIDDISPGTFCNATYKPDNCTANFNCTCTYMIDVPLNSIVELIIFDTAFITDLAHPFHLHGHDFSVLGMGVLNDSQLTVKNMMDMDKKGLLHRNFDQPPSKDTLIVSQSGYVIIRFNASNPGFWFFHCHIVFHINIGMNLIFHVGEQSDLPPVPDNFPKCGNYLPPL